MDNQAFWSRHKHPIRLFIVALSVTILSGGYLFFHQTQKIEKTASVNSPPDQNIIKKINKKTESKNKKPVTVTSTTQQKNIGQPQLVIPINEIKAEVIVDSQSYPASLMPESSVYDALFKLNAEKKIQVTFKSYSGLGYFVDEINGVKSDKLRGKYWIYYINGVKAQTGISTYIIKSGDVIIWKFESAE